MMVSCRKWQGQGRGGSSWFLLGHVDIETGIHASQRVWRLGGKEKEGGQKRTFEGKSLFPLITKVQET